MLSRLPPPTSDGVLGPPELPGAASQTGSGASSTEIGNAHHAFLQWVSLACPNSLDALKREAQLLQASGRLTAEQVAVLDFPALAAFWDSPIGHQIRALPACVHRELPFTARFSAADPGPVYG